VSFNWKKLLFWTIAIIVIVIAFIYIFGLGSPAKAATVTQAKVCRVYPHLSACSPEAQPGQVIPVQTAVISSKHSNILCKTVTNYNNFSNKLGGFNLFWVKLTQYACFRGKKVVATLPPQFTHGTTTIGALDQWDDTDKEAFSIGVIPWEGFARGAYYTWASDKFKQDVCVPLFGCVTFHTVNLHLSIANAFDGDKKGY